MRSSRCFVQRTADINGAISEVIAEAQVGLKQFSPGITAPLALSYDASSVPILQLGLSGKGMSEQQLSYSRGHRKWNGAPQALTASSHLGAAPVATSNSPLASKKFKSARNRLA